MTYQPVTIHIGYFWVQRSSEIWSRDVFQSIKMTMYYINSLSILLGYLTKTPINWLDHWQVTHGSLTGHMYGACFKKKCNKLLMWVHWAWHIIVVVFSVFFCFNRGMYSKSMFDLNFSPTESWFENPAVCQIVRLSDCQIAAGGVPACSNLTSY